MGFIKFKTFVVVIAHAYFIPRLNLSFCNTLENN